MSIARDIGAIASVPRTPPSSPGAERSVLGAVFIKPAAFDEVATSLQVDDFFLPAHREIFESMLALDKRRQPIDVIAVADELKVKGMLPRLEGGESYLLALANGVPTAENILHYARLVKEKSTLRRLIATCAEVQSSAYGDFGDGVAALATGAADRLKDLAMDAMPAAPTLATIVDRLVPLGQRMPTGLRTFDTAHRGGPQPGRLIVVGGAPGAGKTSLAIDLAVRWALDGVRVAVLAADEPAQGLLVRIGQLLGLAREDLEAATVGTLEALREALAGVPTLTLLDADEDAATVESAAGVLHRSHGRAVLVVDSLQTARAAGSLESDNPRARVDAVLTACKGVARRGVLVLATCELARGAYRSRDAAERTDDLAAGKESGSIEYSASTLMVLRSVPDEVGLIDVALPKNRGGERTPFRLVMDFARARLQEIALPVAADGGESRMDPAIQLETDMTAAREVLRHNKGLAGYERLRAMMGGMSMARRTAAVKALRDSSEIIDRGTRQQPRLYLRGTEPDTDSGVSPTRPTGPTVGSRGPHPTALPTPIGGRAMGRPERVDPLSDERPVGRQGDSEEAT